MDAYLPGEPVNLLWLVDPHGISTPDWTPGTRLLGRFPLKEWFDL
jgi:hypothetical protein